MIDQLVAVHSSISCCSWICWRIRPASTPHAQHTSHPSSPLPTLTPGHFQYLDGRGGVMDAICAVGSAPDASVAALTQAAMVAWAETMVRGDPMYVGHSVNGSIDDSGGSSGGGRGSRGGVGAAAAADVQQAQAPLRLRMGVDGDGNIVAGLASWDAASRLFATSQQARELLAEGASKGGSGKNGNKASSPPDFSTRLKNFQLLFGN